MKRFLPFYILLLATGFAGMPLRGQTTTDNSSFTDFPATDFPVSADRLPEYATRFELGYNASDNVSVRLEYPEYAPLTAAESRILKEHFGEAIPDTIVPRTEYGISRKQGLLDVWICPFVKKNNHFLRLISCKLTLVRPLQSRKQASLALEKAERWKANSVLASGRWVKIRVEEEGIHQLTAAQLADMGFKDLQRVKLYGYGGRMQEENWSFDDDRKVPDDLNEVPLYRRNGSVLFFAEGTVRWNWDASKGLWEHCNQPYSNSSYYFLTEGDAPAESETVAAEVSTNAPVEPTIVHHALLDNDAVTFYAGGREFYDSYNFADGNARTFRLAADGIVSDEMATVDIGFAAASPTAITAQVDINGTLLGNMSIGRIDTEQVAREVRYSFRTEALARDNAFDFTLPASTEGRLNYIRLSYKKTLRAGEKPYAFSLNRNGDAVLQIANASASTRVWRIGAAPAEMKGTLNGNLLEVGIDNARERYVIVDISGSYPSPAIVGVVGNQNLHATTAQDMIIIVPTGGKLTEQAERLAEAHRQKDGLRVKVVAAGQLYNEFSSGTPDASAYRRFMKMLYDRATDEADMPKYLLLFGDCAWDNRMITADWRAFSPDDFLLAFEANSRTVTTAKTEILHGKLDSYVTDDFFGWLDDGEGSSYVTAKLDIGIGRLPCIDAQTAAIYVDKIIAYMENKETGNWKNRIYFLADEGDSNLHMNDAEEVVKQIGNRNGVDFQLRKVYWDAYKRTASAIGFSYPQVTEQLQNYMKQGALMFNYSGHGSPAQLSHSWILTDKDFCLSSAGRLPLWVMASCEICPYDAQTSDIGRLALTNPTGGAIAMMCASRSVYSNYNRNINIRFCNLVLSTDADGKARPMGEALRQSKVGLIDGSGYGTGTSLTDGTINKLKYVLLGDPALALALPTRNITLDSINGAALKSGDKVQLQAGSVVRFSGHIGDTTPLSDFNGRVSITLMDREEQIVCKNNNGDNVAPKVYADRTKTVFTGQDSVRNGRFAIEIPIPRDISYTDDSGRAIFYAVNSDNTLEAHGHDDRFCLNGTDPTAPTDTLAPKVFIYLNTPDFPNGGVVGSDAIFMADISDDCGINVAGISIGHDLELTIDNNQQDIRILNDYFSYDFGSYSSGTVVYPLTDLAPGSHTLSFRVWDVNNNTSTATLEFRTGQQELQTGDVTATQNPAYTSTRFVTRLPADGENAITLEVYDVAGRLVWTSGRQTTPSGYHVCTWNLTTTAGTPLPAGLYLYRAKIDSKAGNVETKAKKIVILRQ